LIKRFISFIRSNHLVHPDDVVILAVSGGLDSMAMLSLFEKAQAQLKLHLRVLHINHHVREDSDRDEILVGNICRQKKVPFTVKHLQGFDLSSSEEVLRQARYSAFEQELDKFPVARLATGHQLDDQIETVLMRLAKGSSLKGLTGIPVRRGAIIRPMLFLSRHEIERYVEQNKIPFRNDYTNDEDDHLRNRIRHQIVPAFRKVFGADFDRNMARSLTELSQIHRYISLQNEHDFGKLLEQKDREFYFNIRAYQKLPLWRRRQFLQYCISLIYPVNSFVSGNYFRAFDWFVESAAVGASFIIAQEAVAVKNRISIQFSQFVSHKAETKELFPGQIVYLGRNKISAEKVHYKDIRFSSQANLEYICCDQIKGPLTVRYWQPGDWFIPLGMKGRQKLSDFFVNRKIDRLQKNYIPLVCYKKQIIWVAGWRLDERFKVRPGCKNFMKLSMEVQETL